MPMREPPSRRQRARASSNDPRRLSDTSPTLNQRNKLKGKAKCVPYAKHKKHPAAFNLQPYAGEDEDPSFCDEHANFGPHDMLRVPALLSRGIDAGLFGKTLKKGDPGLLWSVDDNGWIYEAQLTNPGYAEYHAYPVLPNEAIARKVLVRYAQYVAQTNSPVLNDSLILAYRRYR